MGKKGGKTAMEFDFKKMELIAPSTSASYSCDADGGEGSGCDCECVSD